MESATILTPHNTGLSFLNFDIFSIRISYGVSDLCDLSLDSFHSFIFKLYIMIIHTLQTCTFPYFFSNIKKDAAKFVACYSRDWRFKG